MSAKKALIIPCCILALGSALLSAQEELKSGVILDKVICRQSPAHSYALYLPSGYSVDKSWPILYALDPAAQGRMAVERFAPAAEKLQVIVVGSNEARNGPWGPIFNAVLAMWDDTRQRFRIDPKQVYAAGFSGGSRAASMFMRIVGEPVAAIIGCGAGLATDLSPADIKPAFYYGVVGLEDFNYQEMSDLEAALEEKGLPHRFLVFDGPHAWPSSEVCQRALGWLVCLAMAQGLRPNEDKTVQEVFSAELEAARRLEASGRILRALRDYQALAQAFPSLAEPQSLQAKVEKLKKSPDLTRALKKEKSLRQEEKRFADSFQSLLLSVERNVPDLQELYQMLFKLGLRGLVKKAEGPDKPEEKAMACRLLHRFEIEAREKGYGYLEKGDARRSILLFEVAVEASSPFQSRRRIEHYNLACAYALAGNSSEALANIRKSVQNGLADAELLEKEEAFQPLRQHRDFQKILDSLREKK